MEQAEADVNDLERDLEEAQDDPTLQPTIESTKKELQDLNRAAADAKELRRKNGFEQSSLRQR